MNQRKDILERVNHIMKEKPELKVNCSKRQPIKFCVNNNPSSNNGIADCGAIRLSDLPRVNSSFLSAECYARCA